MRYIHRTFGGVVLIYGVLAGSCSFSALQPEKERPSFERYLVVDCYFPDRMIFDVLGARPVPRPPVRTSAGKCSDAGGRYELPNLSSTLKVWLPKAERGDSEAQYFIGQAYESFGETPNYEEAAKWYRRAAEQSPPHRPSAAALARFFEQGLGVKRDWALAADWYIIAADMSDPAEQQRYLEFFLERLRKERPSPPSAEIDSAAPAHRKRSMRARWSRDEMLRAVEDVQVRINKEVAQNTPVNFLLYFAGHGHRVKPGLSNRWEGFWIPTNGPNVEEPSYLWVGKHDITLQPQALRSDHVLVRQSLNVKITHERKAFGVGQAYESFGETPNYKEAAKWYRRAAEQSPRHRPSAAALAGLFERGLGLEPVWAQAADQYVIATGMSHQGEQQRYLEFLLERLKKEKRSPPPVESDLAPPADRRRSMRLAWCSASTTDPAPASRSCKLRDGSSGSGGESSHSSWVADTAGPPAAGQAQTEDPNREVAELEAKLAAAKARAEACRIFPQGCRLQRRLGRVAFGKYYALVIGISDYDEWPKLPTAFDDAQDLARLLEDKYGFEKPVQVVPTATPAGWSKDEMLRAVEDLRVRINKEVAQNTTVNFLLYFAGHGHRVKPGRSNRWEGFWIPTNGPNVEEPSYLWVGKHDITLQLQALRANRVLVIADSCFAGFFERSRQAPVEPSSKDFARIIITSGGDAPAYEIDGAEDSIFTGALLEALQMSQGRLLANDLWKRVKAKMVDKTKHLGVNQEPTYGTIHDAQHVSGDFVFFPGL